MKHKVNQELSKKIAATAAGNYSDFTVRFSNTQYLKMDKFFFFSEHLPIERWSAHP